MEPKKNTKSDVYRKKGLFFNVGLVVALALVIAAFEFKTYDEILVDKPEVDTTLAIIDEPPIVVIPAMPQPPAPKAQGSDIIVVADNKPILKDILPEENPEKPVVGDISALMNNISDVPDETLVPVEIPVDTSPTDEPVTLMAPEMAEGFYEYLGNNIRYTSAAEAAGLEGRMILEFVIEKDGSISDPKILKPVGYGMDEEAIRVIKKAPKWIAKGKHSARIKMRLPINFKITKQ